jgi:hypothetical protein
VILLSNNSYKPESIRRWPEELKLLGDRYALYALLKRRSIIVLSMILATLNYELITTGGWRTEWLCSSFSSVELWVQQRLYIISDKKFLLKILGSCLSR